LAAFENAVETLAFPRAFFVARRIQNLNRAPCLL
jgi:hypothetical protein